MTSHRANDRAANSHQPVRRREREPQRVKSPGSAQHFLFLLTIRSTAKTHGFLNSGGGLNSGHEGMEEEHILHIAAATPW
jgi:hypothetical protein